jgi:hypothetical protein
MWRPSLLSVVNDVLVMPALNGAKSAQRKPMKIGEVQQEGSENLRLPDVSKAAAACHVTDRRSHGKQFSSLLRDRKLPIIDQISGPVSSCCGADSTIDGADRVRGCWNSPHQSSG